MLIAHGVEKKLGICDIETLKELFDVGVWDIEKQEWIEFEVSAYKNELYEFVKWYTSHPLDYLVTFNGIGFDQQVMEWIVDNHQKWFDLTNLEICDKVHRYAQKVIDDSRYGLFPRYKENGFSIPAIDVFKIHHLDNEAKMTSLKWCAYMMNMDVEEMPHAHDKVGLTEQEVQEIRSYRRNDCRVTEGMLYLTLGQVEKIVEINGGYSIEELMDYKGKNKIQDRLDIQKVTGMACLNWSDVKIGEEWNKVDYMSSEDIRDPSLLFPKKVIQPFGQKFKKFFPHTMKFTTEHMQKFIEFVGNHHIKNEKQEFPITIGSTTYTMAKGGLHSTEKNRKVKIPKGFNCTDADVGAQYPKAILKFYIYPPHLKKTIIVNFVKTVELKDKYKQLGKAAEDKILASYYKGLEGGTKLRMNGGYYGKLGQKGSFLEYPEGMMKVAIGNQIEILMLIEMLEVGGFQVISGNTDGIVTLYPTDREEEYLAICKRWEEQVGNTDMGKLEYANFKGLWQESVNSYIAQKVGGEVKKKGRFVTVYGNPGCEINKNKSKRIIPLALEAYFIDGKDPISFIKSHDNIFDFTVAKKATGQMYYEEQWEDKGKVITKRHKKLVRYFVSKKGSVLFKRGINNTGKPMNNHCEAANEIGQPRVTYFNKAYKGEYNIDYDYYILETLERIDNIQKTHMKQDYIAGLSDGNQMTLF